MAEPIPLENREKSEASAHLPQDAPDYIPKSLPAYLEQVEREIILRALQKTRYNKTQAAEM